MQQTTFIKTIYTKISLKNIRTDNDLRISSLLCSKGSFFTDLKNEKVQKSSEESKGEFRFDRVDNVFNKSYSKVLPSEKVYGNIVFGRDFDLSNLKKNLFRVSWTVFD